MDIADDWQLQYTYKQKKRQAVVISYIIHGRLSTSAYQDTDVTEHAFRWLIQNIAKLVLKILSCDWEDTRC